VVEAKAAPPTEPFRDPDKAFVRLLRSFRADTGIQSAFDQANRILKRLRSGERVELYDNKGQVALVLDPSAITAAYAVCFTRDNHGPIATNLNLLLEKAADEPFPWVVNPYDLEAVAEILEYWSIDPQFLLDYLKERLPLNGKAFTSDELDLFAFRLKHKTLDWIARAEADLFVVDPHYADLFDEVYRAKQTGERVTLECTEPVLTDIGAVIRAEIAKTDKGRGGPPPASRNQPCPCGSGKKYKRCHGRGA
jgi:hypothetical protein